MSAKMRWIFGIGVVIVLGSVAGWWFLRDDEEGVVQASVNTTTVIQGAIESSISGSGQIAPLNRETIPLTETGEVAEVMFTNGDLVTEGDILLTFVEEDQSDKVESLEQQLDDAEEELESLQLKFKQAEDEDTREEYKEELDDQIQEISELNEELDELIQEEGLDPITAPISGQLSGFEIQSGETVSNNTDLGEVIDYDQLMIEVSIDELDINKVQLDQSATIVVEAVPDRTYTGKVIDIADEGNVSNGVASFDVTVLLDESTDLKSGMSAEVSIEIASKENVLLLPTEAVQSRGDQHYVLVLAEEGTTGEESDVDNPRTVEGETVRGDSEQGRNQEEAQTGDSTSTQGRETMNRNMTNGQQMVSVEIGIVSEDYVEIVSGVSLGDEVILPNLPTATNTTEENFPARDGFSNFGGTSGGFTPQQTGGFGGGGRR